MNTQTSWFSLIELLVGILIVSFVIIAWFQSLSAVWIAKAKLIEHTRIEKQSYFAAERFFELIKRWWTIDYEEYWNRYSFNTGYINGHFQNQTGFWNFGASGNPGTNNYAGGFYYCESGNGSVNSMGTWWCLTSFNNPWANYDAEPQRYGQYELQFIDHNSDADASWDEDGDGNIIWDADDLYLGIWPEAFPNGIDLWELYLINEAGDERTYFRWHIDLDSSAPTWATCTGTQTLTWTGCLWTIEFLKLVGTDSWYNHLDDGSTGDNDGLIDTWRIHPDFSGDGSSPIAWSNSTDYWQAIFPNDIHVSRAEFYLYPNKNLKSSWRDSSENIKLAPYLQLHLTLEPWWKEKKRISWVSPTTDISTTIQLLDIDLQ